MNNQLWEVNNQIPKFKELVIGTSFFSIQNMCIYSVLYRLYRFIHKLIKFSISVMFSSLSPGKWKNVRFFPSYDCFTYWRRYNHLDDVYTKNYCIDNASSRISYSLKWQVNKTQIYAS